MADDSRSEIEAALRTAARLAEQRSTHLRGEAQFYERLADGIARLVSDLSSEPPKPEPRAERPAMPQPAAQPEAPAEAEPETAPSPGTLSEIAAGIQRMHGDITAAEERAAEEAAAERPAETAPAEAAEETPAEAEAAPARTAEVISDERLRPANTGGPAEAAETRPSEVKPVEPSTADEGTPREVLLSPAEAAGFLHISQLTLERWRAAGRGPRGREMAGETYYALQDLRSFAAARRYSPTPEYDG
jgi:hypothetical protein